MNEASEAALMSRAAVFSCRRVRHTAGAALKDVQVFASLVGDQTCEFHLTATSWAGGRLPMERIVSVHLAKVHCPEPTRCDQRHGKALSEGFPIFIFSRLRAHHL